MYRLIKSIFLGLMRNSIDFFLSLKKKGSIYLQHLIIYCLKRHYFVCCNIFLRAGLLCFHLGLYVESLDVKRYTQAIFLFIITFFILLKILGVLFALIFMATEKLEKTGGIFYFFLPLKVDQIFTKGLCCFYLDIDMNTYKRLSYHIYPWVWLSPIHTFSWELPLGTLRFR